MFLSAVILVTLSLSAAQAAGAPQTPPQTTTPASPSNASANEALWEASRLGDLARVTRALDDGADVNAKARYGATALSFAADKGHADIVKLLLDRGADINAQDTFYRMRAVDMAMMNKHAAVAQLLLERGSKGAPNVLMAAIDGGNVALVKTALASSELTAANLNAALALAKKGTNAEITQLLAARVAALPADATPAILIERGVLQSYVGRYRDESSGVTVAVALNDNQLTASIQGQPPLSLSATSQTAFKALERDGVTIEFAGRGGLIERALVTQNGNTQAFARVTADTPAATPAPTAAASAAPSATPPSATTAAKPVARAAARPWPAFRGDNAAGNGDGQGAVLEWDIDQQQNVRWKTAIPGISTSSPVAWGNRVFVVSSISSAGDATFRTGLYGDVAPVNDLSEHTWKIYCLDKATGKILWQQTAFTGLPKVKRHTKSSQSNSTPVTDGKHVVAMFGSIGVLAAWDMNGRPLWKTDVGVINSGWFFDPEYQWGHSSSPIIYRNMVIVQADAQKGSFLAAFRLDTGKQAWRTDRDEISTWGTPTVFRTGDRDQLVTNGTKVRGYDPATGKLLWTLSPNSEITVATPIVGEGLVYVTGGYPPARPIYAIKPTASGDIVLTKEQTTSDALAWSNEREGTYIPTPIYYQGILYTCGNNGILTAYDAKTGERLYRARVGGGGSFSASPIAADGRLYLANEDGDVYVVKAGRTYEELAKNEMKEVVMSTPAITDGVIIVRTIGHVVALGEK